MAQGVLPNGLRWVHQQVPSPTGHVALILDAGSRDEPNEAKEGLAHFIEHMMFKGTQKRKSFHVLSRLESVGGELNAYTGKEQTTIYGSFLRGDYSRAMELLFDVVTHATFPTKHLALEQDVVLDEIDAYRDQPAEMIFDGFDHLVFPDHALGRNILGRPETVKQFTREDILAFVQMMYHPERAVLSSVGGISAKRFEMLAEKFASQWVGSGSRPQRQGVGNYQPILKSESRAISQSHVIIGGRGLPVDHDDWPTLTLINNLLGGPALNSRLNLNIREKHGIAYHIESFTHAYSDTGMWGIYAGTDSSQMDKCISLIRKELKSLTDTPLGTIQLSRAKTQLLGQIALAQESYSALMNAQGKSLLLLDRVETYKELCDQVNQVSATDLQGMAQTMFDPNQMSQLLYNPS